MQKILNIALAKTLALHILVTATVFVVPTGLNYLVFHGMVLLWLLVTKSRYSSPYFPWLTVLMSVIATGSFMQEAILLPIMYMLFLPYWVQSARYAIKNPYNMVIGAWYRIPQGLEQLFKAYTVYHWAAKRGGWHGIYLLVLGMALLISAIYLSETTLGFQLFMVQLLTEFCIRNSSSRFDKYAYAIYHKVRLRVLVAASKPTIHSRWNVKNETMRQKAKTIDWTSLLLDVFLYVNIAGAVVAGAVVFGVVMVILGVFLLIILDDCRPCWDLLEYLAGT